MLKGQVEECLCCPSRRFAPFEDLTQLHSLRNLHQRCKTLQPRIGKPHVPFTILGSDLCRRWAVQAHLSGPKTSRCLNYKCFCFLLSIEIACFPPRESTKLKFWLRIWFVLISATQSNASVWSSPKIVV